MPPSLTSIPGHGITETRCADYVLHVSVDKEYLVRLMRQRYRGNDLDKQIAAVRAFPTTDAIPADECNDYDASGGCKGHGVDPNHRPAHLLPPDPEFPTSFR